MQRLRHWLVAGCVVVAAAATACGGSSGGSSGPSGSVVDSIDALGSAGTLTTTVRLDATPAALQAAAKASGSTLDAATARAITGASIVIETDKSGDSHNTDVRVVEGSNPLLELRTVNDTLYLQGDVQAILTLFHKQALFANIEAQTKSMPSFVQAVVNGQWVSLPSAALSSLAQAGGSGTSGATSSGPKLLGELRDIVKKDVTVTAAGSDTRGDRYVLSANESVLANDLRSAAVDAVPGGSLLGQRLPSTSANRTIKLDAWVNDGSLAAVSLDLAQFDDSGKSTTPLPLTFTFERSGDAISAPSGAVPVDLTQLGTLFGALSGGSSA